jgi:hypothetical protein
VNFLAILVFVMTLVLAGHGQNPVLVRIQGFEWNEIRGEIAWTQSVIDIDAEGSPGEAVTESCAIRLNERIVTCGNRTEALSGRWTEHLQEDLAASMTHLYEVSRPQNGSIAGK